MFLTYFLPIGSMTFTYARVGIELWGSQSIGECTQRQLENIKSKRRVSWTFSFFYILKMFSSFRNGAKKLWNLWEIYSLVTNRFSLVKNYEKKLLIWFWFKKIDTQWFYFFCVTKAQIHMRNIFDETSLCQWW